MPILLYSGKRHPSGVFMADTGAYIRNMQPNSKTFVNDDRFWGKDRQQSRSRFIYEVGSQWTYKIWDGLYHEVHNEPEKDQVFKFTLDWIKNHMKSKWW